MPTVSRGLSSPEQTVRRFEAAVLVALTALVSCGGPKSPLPQQAMPAKPSGPGKRAADASDDCVPQPGQPPPEPLRKQYTGVAKAARCDREVYTIMGGVSHFLGVECRHCHLEPDYEADTHNKQVANWMARELVPRLVERDAASAASGGGVWCGDCHTGQAKFLGNPRSRGFAVEWMTTHLAESFQSTRGKPVKCKECHGGDLGSPEFRSKIILSGGLALPAPAPSPAAPATATEGASPAPADAASPAPADDEAPAPSPSQPPAGAPLPDYGNRN